ncbi:TetR/AcrR family transcriptional regulator [Corynebacterium sp. 35RC1]|nr:TetR/AcrR family transcriptional regulator [Corynebacterium sp. 35RC1]
MPQHDAASSRRSKHINQYKLIELHATTLVLERGYSLVTVEDIAQAAGVSKRTFFNYFQNKQQAVLGMEPRRPTEEEEQRFLTTVHPDLPLAVLRLCTNTALSPEHDLYFDAATQRRRKAIIDQDPALFHEFMSRIHNLHPHFESLVVRYLEAHPNQRRTGLGLEVEASLLCNLSFAAMRAAANSDENFLAPEELRALGEQMLQGIRHIA